MVRAGDQPHHRRVGRRGRDGDQHQFAINIAVLSVEPVAVSFGGTLELDESDADLFAGDVAVQ